MFPLRTGSFDNVDLILGLATLQLCEYQRKTDEEARQATAKDRQLYKHAIYLEAYTISVRGERSWIGHDPAYNEGSVKAVLQQSAWQEALFRRTRRLYDRIKNNKFA